VESDNVPEIEKRRRYDAYLELRAAALAVHPSQLGAPVGRVDSSPYGVLMEIGLRQGIATLACFSSGHASLYTSIGGGIEGGTGRDVLCQASQRFVKASQPYAARGAEAGSFPLPRSGEVKFYLLACDSAWALEASLNELDGRRSFLSPLYEAGRRVLNELLSSSDDPQSPSP
jgi:hypothetical protein